MKRINLITTCSSSKKSGSNVLIRLSDVKEHATDLDSLAKKWLCKFYDELESDGGYSAASVYKGGHWFNAVKASEQSNVDLWVISAGLGLLHSSDKIINYQATFSSGHNDSIPKYGFSSSIAHQKWWSCLCNLTIPSSRPGSISSLMESRKDELFVVAGSNQYIEAILVDLINGIKHLFEPKSQIVIITSGKLTNGCLDEFLLFSKSKLKGWLGCNMVTLNVCLANKLIEISREFKDDNLFTVKGKIIEKINNIDNVIKKPTVKCTDDEIIKYIAEMKVLYPNVSATNCLEKFRQTGNSAEERRFRRLFNK